MVPRSEVVALCEESLTWTMFYSGSKDHISALISPHALAKKPMSNSGPGFVRRFHLESFIHKILKNFLFSWYQSHILFLDMGRKRSRGNSFRFAYLGAYSAREVINRTFSTVPDTQHWHRIKWDGGEKEIWIDLEIQICLSATPVWRIDWRSPSSRVLEENAAAFRLMKSGSH